MIPNAIPRYVLHQVYAGVVKASMLYDPIECGMSEEVKVPFHRTQCYVSR